MASIVTGGCRCTKVRYQCTADPVAVTLCYCQDCQSWSGGACGHYAIMPSSSMTIVGDVAGYELQTESDRTIRREYCCECGSPLFARTTHLLAITVASFDDPAPYHPTMAIWLDSAQPWAMIPDEIPRFARNPPLSSGTP